MAYLKFEVIGPVSSGTLGNNWFIGQFNNANSLLGDAFYELTGSAIGGNDTLTGGSGALATNDLFGDTQILSGNAEGGDDVITGGVGAKYNAVVGEANFQFDSSIGGNDTITGGEDAALNLLVGDSFWMYDSSAGGDDVIRGGDGAQENRLYGDAFELHDAVTGGSDILYAGDDVTGGNLLIGDAYSMDAGATGGNDTLVSGNSADRMWGDAVVMDAASAGGRDTFVFAAGNATDFIYDFESGIDVIDLTALDLLIVALPANASGRVPEQALAGLAQGGLVARDFDVLDTSGDGVLGAGDDFITLSGADTVIDLGAANGGAAGIDTVTVVGVTGLDEGDFIFA